MRANRATMLGGVCGCEWGAFFVGVWVIGWGRFVGCLGVPFGCWLCIKLYNILVTFWGFWLFGVVFGLWL
jgi:hypothetical protein